MIHPHSFGNFLRLLALDTVACSAACFSPLAIASLEALVVELYWGLNVWELSTAPLAVQKIIRVVAFCARLRADAALSSARPATI